LNGVRETNCKVVETWLPQLGHPLHGRHPPRPISLRGTRDPTAPITLSPPQFPPGCLVGQAGCSTIEILFGVDPRAPHGGVDRSCALTSGTMHPATPRIYPRHAPQHTTHRVASV
jgi:hypothetical protein